MIYVDTSVTLAYLLAEDAAPGPTFWQQDDLVASRLLEYEVWNRLNALSLGEQHRRDASALLGQLAFLELNPVVLARALEPFPVRVRTLDGLHLASIEFLRGLGQHVELSTYDQRLAEAAGALGIPLTRL